MGAGEAAWRQAVDGLGLEPPLQVDAFGTVVFGLLGLATRPAWAQNVPERPLRIIVGVPPGAGPDVETRQFAAALDPHARLLHGRHRVFFPEGAAQHRNPHTR